MDLEETVTVTLSRRDLRLLRRALRYHAGKLERRSSRSTFTPEAGRADIGLLLLAHAQDLLNRLGT